MAEVQTTASVSTTKDVALAILAVIAILGSIVAFYWYDELPLVARVGMVIAGVAVGGGLAWLSSYGHEFVQFFQLARIELRKVVWPSREETVQTTVVVFIFAAAMGVFFFGLDWVLTWMTRFIGGQSS
jgi:preprotein translocase subunit SecE